MTKITRLQEITRVVYSLPNLEDAKGEFRKVPEVAMCNSHEEIAAVVFAAELKYELEAQKKADTETETAHKNSGTSAEVNVENAHIHGINITVEDLGDGQSRETFRIGKMVFSQIWGYANSRQK